MSGQRLQSLRERTQTLFSYGYRPFFLGAALWAAVAIALWMTMLTLGVSLPMRFDPLSWHIHEMLFGFVLAAVAGFLLTAIPEWTGRRPVRGALLALLFGLWLLGRIAAALSALLPVALAIAADIAFPFALAAVIARELVSARDRRNVRMVIPVLVLALAQLLMDLGAEGGLGGLTRYGWRLGLAAVLILVSVIGGRIVPAFTRNWLLRRGAIRLPPAAGVIDRVSLGVLHASLIVWALFPEQRLTSLALLCAAGINFWRLLRWRTADTRAEPLLLVLHVGYAWLVAGVAALGLAGADAAFPLSAAIHALTVGAIGSMILAVMTRATRGHSGYALSADRATSLIYVLVVLAAAARVAAACTAHAPRVWLLIAAFLWVAAFGLFAARYMPMLLRPRRGT